MTAKEITDETRKRNEILAKEIYLSVGRYKLRKKVRMIKKLHEAFKAAMERGVDLNDEATNLMVYQKAYTAACRLMTVLEEALDSLINGMVV